MIFARNEMVLADSYPAAGQDGHFELPTDATKVDFHVFDNDAVVHFSESRPQRYGAPSTEEVRLYKGFQSIPFAKPVTGFKLRRAVSGQASRVSVKAFGYD